MILFSEKEKSTSILLKFLLFIICKYNLILYKYISFHDSMKNKKDSVVLLKGGDLRIKWFKVRNRANTWPFLMRYYVCSASACGYPGINTKWGGGGG